MPNRYTVKSKAFIENGGHESLVGDSYHSMICVRWEDRTMGHISPTKHTAFLRMQNHNHKRRFTQAQTDGVHGTELEKLILRLYDTRTNGRLFLFAFLGDTQREFRWCCLIFVCWRMLRYFLVVGL
jgi:hypothetical protein